MSANTRYIVKVLRLTPDTVEVSAVTSREAMDEAAALPGVAHVLSARDAWLVEHEEEA